MDLIDELFAEANAVSTGEVARAFELSEAQAREWADELGVAKVGPSFAWARPDVEALADQIEAPADENEDGGDGEDDEEDEDEDEEEDEGE